MPLNDFDDSLKRLRIQQKILEGAKNRADELAGKPKMPVRDINPARPIKPIPIPRRKAVRSFHEVDQPELVRGEDGEWIRKEE